LRPDYVGSHSAAFPEEFPHRALLLTCPSGGHVVDPFVGSGTVAVAALKLGLKFTGIGSQSSQHRRGNAASAGCTCEASDLRGE
jgi:DNA modification methylase